MKFKIKPIETYMLLPKLGDKRVSTKFIWFPTNLRIARTNNMQTRWLEAEQVHQEYRNVHMLAELSGYDDRQWVNISWFNPDMANEREEQS